MTTTERGPQPPHDVHFETYARAGAVFWRDISGHWIHHNAFTAERYRRVIAAAWRPRFLLRVPVFRVLCNLLSIYARVNALTWLGMRPRLFMTQLAVLEKD